jgi:hypothetical protein
MRPLVSPGEDIVARRVELKIMRAAVSVLLVYLTALPRPARATDYSTKFPHAEPLISEGG